MIELHDDELEISFPELHPEAQCFIKFQRTLRIPDDNQDYALPAGLGAFPMLPVDDFPVPDGWKRRGGVFLPIYQSEAMWIQFVSGGWEYPMAVKIASGKVNAVTGEPWTNALSTTHQDYIVIPGQPWLDGFNVSKGIVRQFVAMRLGEGLTAEEQITGEAQWGGLQLIAYPMKAAAYRRVAEERDARRLAERDLPMFSRRPSAGMGLAAGGRIRQEIMKDPYGLDAWDTTQFSRCFVHLLDSESYRVVTGREPPTKPFTAHQYKEAGVPWFDYYVDGPVLKGSATLAKLDSVAAALLKKGESLSDNKPITISSTISLGSHNRQVRDGEF